MLRSTATWFTLLTCLFFKQCQIGQSKKTVVCYYRNWAQYYKKLARYVPEDIDPSLCTVVSYAAMQVNLETHKLVGRQRNDDEMLDRMKKLRNNTDMKVVVSVGGWSHEYKKRFSNMASSPDKRAIFINSTIKYLADRDLDGVNLDWEYPAVRPRGVPRSDKQRFTSLLKEMRSAFDRYAQEKKAKRFSLTLSVSSSPSKVPKAYEIAKIGKYVDWVDVMAYTLRGSWNRVTGCPSLMKGREPTTPGAIDMWIKGGMPRNKINVGMATYGRSYQLEDASANNLGDRITKKGGDPGLYTKKRGILAYYEICLKNWTQKVSWENSSCGISYASNGRDWVTYETPGSVANKVSQLVNAKGLNGVSFWALDFDDRTGESCHQGKYPLLSAAVKTMANAIEGETDVDEMAKLVKDADTALNADATIDKFISVALDELMDSPLA